MRVVTFLLFYFFWFDLRKYDLAPGTSSYGHTTMKAPHPIRTAKLSIVGLVQYFGRGLQGNHQCCMAFLVFTHLRFFFYFVNVPVLASGVLAQSEACVLSKHEVLGSKPRYSSPIWCSW